MNEQLIFIFETSQSLSDTGCGAVGSTYQKLPYNIYRARVEYGAKKSVSDNCRYEIISESQFPPDFDNYTWDYSNCDGYGSSSFFTQSWDEYVTQSLSL